MQTSFTFPYLEGEDRQWAKVQKRSRHSRGNWARHAINWVLSEHPKVIEYRPTKRGRGRGEVASARKLYQLQANSVEIQKWRRAAERLKIDCSELCRQALDYAAQAGYTAKEHEPTGGRESEHHHER